MPRRRPSPARAARRAALGAALALATAAAGSARAETPALSWLTPAPAFETFAIPDSGRFCRAGAPLALDATRPTTLSLTLDGATAPAALDGAPTAPAIALPLSAGRHLLYLQPRAQLLDALAPSTLVVSWTDPAGDGRIEQRLADDLANRPVLAVGRTFLSGVDLLDGQLVRPAAGDGWKLNR